MSGVGSIGGQGSIYPEYVGGPQAQWDGRTSGDLKKDLETAKNALQDLITKIKNGNFNPTAEFPNLEKLATLLSQMNNQYGSTLSEDDKKKLGHALYVVNLSIEVLRRGDLGNYFEPIQKTLKNGVTDLESILQSLK